MTFVAYTPSQLNLILQIVIFIFLMGGLSFKQKGKFIQHGTMMLAAIILNMISFLLVMWPSFRGFDVLSFDSTIKYVAFLHGVLGAIAEVLGVFLVASWGLRKSVAGCSQRKSVMRLTLTLWIISLFLGFLIYALLYGIVTI